MNRRHVLVGYLGTVAVAAVCTFPVMAASALEERESVDVSHEVAFTCGFDPPGATNRILPGQYATAVNICNRTNRPIHFRLRVSLTFPDQAGGSEIAAGPVSDPITRCLQPREALEVDCGEIPALFFPGLPTPPYIQGFVLIESAGGLGVSAVHTAGRVDPMGNIEVVSIDVEQIEPRFR